MRQENILDEIQSKNELSKNKFKRIGNFASIFRNLIMPRLNPKDIIAAAHSCQFFRAAIPQQARINAMLEIRNKPANLHDYGRELEKDDISEMHIKACVLGDTSVNKSALIRAYAASSFSNSYTSTIGIEYCSKTIPVGSAAVKMKIWDVPSYEQSRALLKGYYQDAQIIYLVCDMKKGLVAAQEWLQSIKELRAQEELVCILLVKNAACFPEALLSSVGEHKIRAFFAIEERDASSVNTGFDLGVRWHLERRYPLLKPPVEVEAAEPAPKSKCNLM